MPKITKHWRISRLLKEYPVAIEVLLENDIPCAGCSGASTERLHEGLASHGLNEQEIDDIVQEINQALEQYAQAQSKAQLSKLTSYTFEAIEAGIQLNKGLIITHNALQAFKKYKPNNANIIQIKLEAGGCSGYNYNYEFVQEQDSQLQYSLIDGLVLGTDIFTIESSNDLTIDYKESLQFTGFIFDNKKAQQKCSCGKSMGF